MQTNTKALFLLITVTLLLVGMTAISAEGTENGTNPEPETPVAPESPETPSETHQKDVTNYEELNRAISNTTDETVTVNIKNDITLNDSTSVNNQIKNLTINGNGKTVDGQKLHQFLNINTPVNTTLNNLNIINCINEKGAIYAGNGSMLTIQNCTFRDNQATGENSYVIDITDAESVKIADSRFTNNTDNKKDMLLSDTTSTNVEITDNTYKNNYLETDMTQKNDVELTAYDWMDEEYNFNVEVTSRSIYNNPVTTGQILLQIGTQNMTIPVNSTKTIVNIPKEYIKTNESIVTYTYIPEENNYQSTNKSFKLNINPLDTYFMNVTAHNGTYKNTSITIDKVFSQDMIPIKNETIHVLDKNGNIVGTGITDENGTVKMPVTLPVGEHNVTAYHPENIWFMQAYENTTITVTGITPVLIIKTDTNKVDNTNMTITLLEPDGTPIPNATVIISIPNTLHVNATTDENGTAIIQVSLKEGTYNATGIFEGNEKYNPTTNNTTLNITRNRANIKLDPVMGIIGENITLTAYLTGDDGKLVTSGNLAFKLNGKTLRSDGRFDSNASAMKLKVKDGKVNITLKADLYLRNAKNLTASYSGNYKYEEATSDAVEAQIQKRNAQLTVNATPTRAAQYESIKFTATVQDITNNTYNTTLINQNTSVIFKINGKTLKDDKNNTITVQVDENRTAVYTYTIPAGMGGINSTKDTRDYKVEAVFAGINYYPTARNTTKFNIERSNTTINIQNTTVTGDNKLSIKAAIRDYKENNVVGINKITIKINGKSYTDRDGNYVYWNITDGNINLKDIPVDTNTTIKRVMIVTGERQAYLETRNETTNITKA